ncbi:MAG: hypothetical protein RR840_04110 [Clostridium sp.]
MEYTKKQLYIILSIVLTIWIISFGIYQSNKVDGYEVANHLEDMNVSTGIGIELYIKQPKNNSDTIIGVSFPEVEGLGNKYLKAGVSNAEGSKSYYDMKKLTIGFVKDDGYYDEEYLSKISNKNITKIKIITASGKEYIRSIGEIYINKNQKAYDPKYSFDLYSDMDKNVANLNFNGEVKLIGIQGEYLDKVIENYDIHINGVKLTTDKLPLLIKNGDIKVEGKMLGDIANKKYDVEKYKIIFKFLKRDGSEINSYLVFSRDNIGRYTGVETISGSMSSSF